MESQKPPNAEPAKRSSSIPNRLPMARRGLGRTGETIQLVTNHFKVSMHSNTNTGAHFYQYNVPLESSSLLWKHNICMLFEINNLIFSWNICVGLGISGLWRWAPGWCQRYWQKSYGQSSWDLSHWDGWYELCLWWREEFVYNWLSSKQKAPIHGCLGGCIIK